MSQIEIPTGIPIIGAQPELRKKLRAELSSKRADKQPGKAFQKAVENPHRRDSIRYETSQPAICYPIAVSNEIDNSASLAAIVADISQDGMMILMDSAQPHTGLELMIGVETASGSLNFCSGTVVASKRNVRGMTEVNIRFGGYIHQLLQNDMLFPVLDRNQMQFELPYPDRTMASLCKVGAAVSSVLDVVMVCPHCQAIPTLRNGCSLCLSSNVNASKMIHHFACAHVDFVDKFETEDGLLCQKCRTKHMLVGSDYEYLDGPKHCEDCGKANLETIQIGHCLNCEHRFPFETATKMEIVGYRVNRLDTLALIDSH